MTVKELIVKLQKFPEDYFVRIKHNKYDADDCLIIGKNHDDWGGSSDIEEVESSPYDANEDD